MKKKIVTITAIVLAVIMCIGGVITALVLNTDIIRGKLTMSEEDISDEPSEEENDKLEADEELAENEEERLEFLGEKKIADVGKEETGVNTASADARDNPDGPGKEEKESGENKDSDAEPKTESKDASQTADHDAGETSAAPDSNSDIASLSAVQSQKTESEIATQTATVHIHDYQMTDIVSTSCTSDGTRRYTCSGCGQTYDEPIPAEGHHFANERTVVHHDAVTDTVHHDEIGHYEEQPKFERYPVCNHCGEDQSIGFDGAGHVCKDGTYCMGWHSGYRQTGFETIYVTDVYAYDETVVISSEWDETVVTRKCSVCGIEQ